MASRFLSNGVLHYSGPWAHTRTGYLGIKFLVDGKIHYGWARVSIDGFPATLTGYAYETIPDKPIPAGRISGPTADLTVPLDCLASGATLGLLARGAEAMTLWRRKEEEAELF